jgi:predicted PurR-regulated permease PerM
MSLFFKKHFITALTLMLILFFLFLFTKIFIYITISMVLALLGSPIMNFMSKLKIGKFKINPAIASIITLSFFIFFVYSIGRIFIPPLISQIAFLSQSDLYDVLQHVLTNYPSLKANISKLGSEQEITENLTLQINHFANFQNLSSIFNNAIYYTTSILGGTFSVLFITFFFLKDEKLAMRGLLLITPTIYEKKILEIVRKSKKMLSNYFIGLFIDIFLVSIIVTSLMWFFDIKNALVIGCLAGILNIIPYLGPIITLLLAAFLGVNGCIEYNQYELISITLAKIIAILVGTNLLDAFLIQPLIFSNTVKAHPLEIFIVILMSASIGGIIWMVIAIPTYTLLRIIAKEFLINLKFFRKLTENIPE